MFLVDCFSVDWFRFLLSVIIITTVIIIIITIIIIVIASWSHPVFILHGRSLASSDPTLFQLFRGTPPPIHFISPHLDPAYPATPLTYATPRPALEASLYIGPLLDYHD